MPATDSDALIDPLFITAGRAAASGALAQKFLDDSRIQDGKVFLTVLMRTQGKRLNALKDTLTTLSGQSCQDFEVMVLEHDVAPAVHEQIETIVSSFPSEFSERVSFLPVAGGGRSRPLNRALPLLKSSYVAALDDDDIVFGHWVSEFKTGATRAPGRAVRSLCAVQEMGREEWPDGTVGFRASTWPDMPFQRAYSQIEHLRANQSPFMSVALPVGFFSAFGNTFDEELAVCEDWDIILRAGKVCGFVQQDEVTAIYRKWTGVETSYTHHAAVEWAESEARVIAKLNAEAYTLEQGSIVRVRELATVEDLLISFGTSGSYSFLFVNGVLRLRFRIYLLPLLVFLRSLRFLRRALRRLL